MLYFNLTNSKKKYLKMSSTTNKRKQRVLLFKKELKIQYLSRNI